MNTVSLLGCRRNGIPPSELHYRAVDVALCLPVSPHYITVSITSICCNCLWNPIWEPCLRAILSWLTNRNHAVGPIVSAPDDRWVWSNRWNKNWQGKPKYSEKASPSPLCPPQIPHGIELRTPSWEAGDCPPELWHERLTPRNPCRETDSRSTYQRFFHSQWNL
jgi:hypothetical protein